MAKIVEAQQPSGPAKCLFLFLPGAGDHAATFREQGFIDELQGTGWSVDLVAADATMGYYFRGIDAQRLELDVAAPSREPGQQQIWLVGASMGGFGTLNYSMRYPDHVNGILAIAPYLGARSIAEEVAAAGGLLKWAPDAKAELTEDNYQRQLWSYLHRVVTGTQEHAPSLYLGWGDTDDLGKQGAVLAAALPAGHVFHAPGGHDWPVWRELLRQFLLTPEIKAACAR